MLFKLRHQNIMKIVYARNGKCVQILAILSACFSSMGNGMQHAWTSPTIPKLIADKTTNINIEKASYFVIFQAMSLIISAPLLAGATNLISRKIGVLLVAVPQIASWMIIACTTNIWLLYLSRVIAGIGDAAFYATVPIYVCEITEPNVRHIWGVLISISLYFGVFLINAIGATTDVSTAAWICLCLSSIHLITFSWVPESPYYLLIRNEMVLAKKALQTLRHTLTVDVELESLRADVTRQTEEEGTWKDLFLIGTNRKALLIVSGIRIVQQLSGLTAFEVYTQYMFEEANVEISSATSAIVFSGMIFFGTFISANVANRFGRKPLLLISTFGCGCSLVAEAIYFGLQLYTNVNVSRVFWFPLCGIIIYVSFCSLGLATAPVILAGEMFSSSIKSKATIAINIIFALCILLIPKLFQTLANTYNIFLPFLLFALCCFVGLAFVGFYVIETKGKILEEIQQELKHHI